MKRHLIWQLSTAILLAIFIILSFDLITNRIEEIRGHAWDFVYYQDIAQNGLAGNDHLVSPYAYRYLTMLIARWLMLSLQLSMAAAFKYLTYIGAFFQLMGVYALSRELKFRHTTSLALMLVIAFSLFHIKFLLFDMYRPDHLAYPLLILALITFLRRKYVLCALISAIGLQMREMLIIPPAICLFYLLLDWRKNKSDANIYLQASAILIITALAVILPRKLIPVVFTQQHLDPLNDPKSILILLSNPLNLKRNVNIFFALSAYALPLWLITTKTRIVETWQRIKPLQPALIIYTILMLFLTMYGGADIDRFVTYLFIPLIIFVGHIINNHAHPLETIFMLIATLLFNKILLPFPIWDFYAYLDFYGGYGDRVNDETLKRFGEILSFILIAILWRQALQPNAKKQDRLQFPDSLC